METGKDFANSKIARTEEGALAVITVIKRSSIKFFSSSFALGIALFTISVNLSKVMPMPCGAKTFISSWINFKMRSSTLPAATVFIKSEKPVKTWFSERAMGAFFMPLICSFFNSASLIRLSSQDFSSSIERHLSTWPLNEADEYVFKLFCSFLGYKWILAILTFKS